MGKRNSDKCGDYGVKENVQHILIHCKKYEAEIQRLQDRVREEGTGLGFDGDTGNRG